MKNTFKKIGIAFLAAFTLGMLATYFLSPFQPNAKGIYEIKHEVIINASVQKVYDYLGQSKNAKQWSIFVENIQPLNADEVRDGNLGSIRRCYVKKEHLSNAFWDEKITKVIPNKMRQLLIFNHTNFSTKSEGLYTEQQFEVIDKQTTRVLFNVFYKENKCNTIDWVKTYLTSFVIQDIFAKNMKNIKYELENTTT